MQAEQNLTPGRGMSARGEFWVQPDGYLKVSLIFFVGQPLSIKYLAFSTAPLLSPQYLSRQHRL
jgi:hypothetical protein